MYRQIALPFLYYLSGCTDAKSATLDLKSHDYNSVIIQETNLRRRVSDLEDRHKRDKVEKDGNFEADEFTFDAASSTKCAVSKNGSYGTPTPEASTLEVKYYYEMEYDPETDSEEELLSAVEKSIGSSVVSVFFKECRARRLVSKADISTDTKYGRNIPDKAKYERTNPIHADNERTYSNNETLETKDHLILDDESKENITSILRNDTVNEESKEDITISRRNDTTATRGDRLSKYANRTKNVISSLVEALDNQPSLIVEGASCQSVVVDAANPCVVIESITYVHYNKDRASDAVERLIAASLRIIEYMMDSGFFDRGVHEDIRKVTYIGTRPNYEEPVYETSTVVIADSDDEPVYYAIIVSSCLALVAAIMAVSAIIVTKMKKRDADKKDELYNENDPDDNDSSDIENENNNASGNAISCNNPENPTEHGYSDSSHREKSVRFEDDRNAYNDNVINGNEETSRVATEEREGTDYSTALPNPENLSKYEGVITTEMIETNDEKQ